ncbi:MAG: TAT-variant-translocated molybdopterin oxidoreductase [Acetobacteraceae bacterium]|nr:TAT-variant-translocated molybdopterin oxidoreductase [Acetobacteraceae bacterium]
MNPIARQWRSLAELENDPAFLERAAQEFPSLREALMAPRQRRQVLRFVAAALAAGGLAGCYAGEPSGHLIPAVRSPPEIVPGTPNHYATAHVLGGYALGTVVTHQMGRPIKVEGNPRHPSSLGATDPYAQADVLGFYDPDRSMVIGNAGVPASRQALLAAIVSAQGEIAATRGAGFRVLAGATSSPTFARLRQRLLAAYPEARWHVWEPVNRDRAVRGAMLAYGQPVELVPRLDAADVILGLDSDLLGAAPGWVRYARAFASRRNPTRTKAMSRVYAAEPSPTLLGSVADQRFVAGPQELNAAVVALGHSLLQGAPADAPGAPSWVKPVVADLQAHRGRAFIHAGPELSPESHALVFAMNEALGGRGATYDLLDPVLDQPEVISADSLAALTEDMRAGRVSTLLVIDANPAFNAPGTLDFAGALQRVGLSFALCKAPDETARLATWSVPMAHDWETWGDARGHDGTATILQPMALPLYAGLSAGEVIARFLGETPGTDREAVQATWRASLGDEGFDAAWRQALAEGVVPGTARAKADVRLRESVPALSPPTPPGGALSLLFRPDPRLWDGRYANNPQLQELPEPLTKLTWDNPLLISPDLARRTGLRNGDKVNLRSGSGAISLPVWVQPGQAGNTVLAWLGNGRRVTGGVGTDTGWDVYPLTGGDGTATLERADGKALLASTDHHTALFQVPGTVSGIVKHTDLETYQKNPSFPKDSPKPELYWRKPPGPTAWAMSVDLNACIGCNACVIACQAENNVPTVGKELVLREREMHWLRIDRYYEGTPDAPESFFQPMLCMHCEKAPCELVCPVGATVTDSEGLNVQVYNRCVGTRFCSNNCPYKVRRFNFFDFADEQNRPAVSWNPDVSVRARGVMEKCTYCLQRIAAARIAADKESRRVYPQEVVTACQAACPTQAFTFGDMAQPDSDVAKRRRSPLDYALLEDQHTHPRTTYEALVRNPNPDLKETLG